MKESGGEAVPGGKGERESRGGGRMDRQTPKHRDPK